MKQIIFIAIFAISSTISFSQVKQIQLQAAGLTCSMCSKAVFKSLSAIPFVKEVKADIKTSSYTIILKDENIWDFDMLRKSVENAGFSVAQLIANITFSKTKIENDTHLKYAGKAFHFLNVQPQTLDGNYNIKIIDKNFVTAKEFKSNSKFTNMKCYQTGILESCCNKTAGKSGDRIYHITLKN